MLGFVSALESEAGQGFVGVRGLVTEVAWRDVIGVSGVGWRAWVRQLARARGRPGFLGSPESEAGRGDVIGVPGPSRKKSKN